MRDLQRVRKATLAILAALLDGEMCGIDISARTRIRHPTVYAALARLVDHGWATSRQEPAIGRLGQPRRFYTLVPEGRRAAAHLLKLHGMSTVDVVDVETQGRAA